MTLMNTCRRLFLLSILTALLGGWVGDEELNKQLYIIPTTLENTQITINLKEYTPYIQENKKVYWENVTFVFIKHKSSQFNLRRDLINKVHQYSYINNCKFIFKD